ncbi:glycosyltransferase family 2 protein [Thiolapillus sp.]
MHVTNISICVLNWENYADTQRCIVALLDLPELHDDDLSASIIVIDNGSQDGSFSRLKKFISEASHSQARIFLIGMPENIGYAAGNNVGIRYAVENQRPDYVWVLNNDTIPQSGCLRALVGCASADRSVGVWGSTILNADGSVQCAGGCYYNSWLGIMKLALPKNGLEENLSRLDRPLDYVSGASMLISSEIIQDFGMLSEDYFLYYEELDYAQRIKGKRAMGWCKKSKLVHIQWGGGGGKLGRVREYHSIQSLLIYTRKYYPYKIPSVLLALFLAKPFLYVLRNNPDYFYVLFAAIKGFFTGKTDEKYYPRGNGQ